MKHIFIVNPAAGVKDFTQKIKELIEKTNLDIDYTIHITGFGGEAIEYVKKVLSQSGE